MDEIGVKLTDTELEQLLLYCDWAAENGYYYGRQDYFLIRHRNIVETLRKEMQKRLDKHRKA